MMLCLINKNKLLKFEFANSYSKKLAILEKEMEGIHTDYNIHTSEGLNFSTVGSISDGIKFFRSHNISDDDIYVLLSSINFSRIRIRKNNEGK